MEEETNNSDLFDNMASDNGSDGMDRNKENTGVSLNTKGDNEDDDDFEDDDEDFEDEDVRAREFQLKLRAESDDVWNETVETSQRESLEGTVRKTMPQYIPLLRDNRKDS